MEFSELPEFAREFKRLQKKYRSLENDLASFKPYLAATPQGNGGRHWNCLREDDLVSIYKVRLVCRYLRSDDLRIIYAHRPDSQQIVFIELYYKGDKDGEDEERIRRYLKGNF